MHPVSFLLILGLKALQKTTPLVTQNLDHPISAQIPPLSAQNLIHSSPKPQHIIRSSPKPPSPPISHSPISSPSYSNTIQEVSRVLSRRHVFIVNLFQTPLFAPLSPTLPIDSSLQDSCNYNSDDGYTSADAEGESIAGCDSIFEVCFWHEVFSTSTDINSVCRIFSCWYPTNAAHQNYLNNPSALETIISQIGLWSFYTPSYTTILWSPFSACGTWIYTSESSTIAIIYVVCGSAPVTGRSE